MTYVWMIVGLVLLVLGGELLVSGASRLAKRFGVSSLVIGLTVVAFGTSAPELAVSINAAYQGSPDIALGNVVGSNIFNVLFILGFTALIVPLTVASQLVRREVPIMIGASVVLLVMALDGRIERWEGVMLAGGIVAYTVYTIASSRKETLRLSQQNLAEGREPEPSDEATGFRAHPLFQIALVVTGLVVLVLGSRLLVNGAVAMARSLGVSELVIGLTIVSAGTSLPEVAASVMAAVKGERDIAAGNAIGSNIFNILSVLGLASVVAPSGIAVSTGAIEFDIPVMLAVAVACLPVFYTGHLISRWEGGLFLAYYVFYVVYLVLDARHHPMRHDLGRAVLFFVVPMTVLTLAVFVWRYWRERSGSESSTGGPART